MRTIAAFLGGSFLVTSWSTVLNVMDPTVVAQLLCVDKMLGANFATNDRALLPFILFCLKKKKIFWPWLKAWWRPPFIIIVTVFLLWRHSLNYTILRSLLIYDLHEGKIRIKQLKYQLMRVTFKWNGKIFAVIPWPLRCYWGKQSKRGDTPFSSLTGCRDKHKSSGTVLGVTPGKLLSLRFEICAMRNFSSSRFKLQKLTRTPISKES